MRRVIDYNADEQARADRAEGYSTDNQPYRPPSVSAMILNKCALSRSRLDEISNFD
jgi:hypothetical protein